MEAGSGHPRQPAISVSPGPLAHTMSCCSPKADPFPHPPQWPWIIACQNQIAHRRFSSSHPTRVAPAKSAPGHPHQPQLQSATQSHQAHKCTQGMAILKTIPPSLGEVAFHLIQRNIPRKLSKIRGIYSKETTKPQKKNKTDKQSI